MASLLFLSQFKPRCVKQTMECRLAIKNGQAVANFTEKNQTIIYLTSG